MKHKLRHAGVLIDLVRNLIEHGESATAKRQLSVASGLLDELEEELEQARCEMVVGSRKRAELAVDTIVLMDRLDRKGEP